MGCGSSSLKGEYPTGTSEPAPQPINKVTTNFSDVDYLRRDGTGKGTGKDTSKDNKDLAPDERPTNQHQSNGGKGTSGEGGNAAELKPDPIYPHEKVGASDGIDQGPTSSAAKANFVDANDPASTSNQVNKHSRHDKPVIPTLQSSAAATSETNFINPYSTNLSPSSFSSSSEGREGEGGYEGRKKSWLGAKYSAYQDAKLGRNNVISDEQLKEYTGMDRRELDEWAEGRDGVGGKQSPIVPWGIGGA